MKTFILIIIFTSLLHAETYIDNFSEKSFEKRQAQRGEWKFENNIASCKSDPELYKKYNNHGPIIRYGLQCKSGTTEFEMKAKDCSRIVFTFNGEGHIFRVCLADKDKTTKWIYTRVICWETRSSKENKGTTIKPKGMPTADQLNDQWVKFKVETKANKATLVIGDFSTEINHTALSRDKKSITLSFAQGELAIKNFKFTPGK